MLLGIDHLVIAVPDPDAAAADLEAALGIAATGGGRHEQAGTFNRLIFLGDTYLELIGVWDRALASAHPIGAAALAALDAGAPGLVTWAIATDGARREVAALRAAGSAIGDALPGERISPGRRRDSLARGRGRAARRRPAAVPDRARAGRPRVGRRGPSGTGCVRAPVRRAGAGGGPGAGRGAPGRGGRGIGANGRGGVPPCAGRRTR